MLSLKNVKKEYVSKTDKVVALNDISIDFETNGLYFITGPSGSGKTTLLNILSGIDTPSSGIVLYNENNINNVNFRKEFVGLVFQDFNLIDDFSIIDNLRIAGCDDYLTLEKVLNYLDLSSKINTKVKNLSGGEKQRLAIGRAMVKKTEIFLLDEPTGNLDFENATKVFELLKTLSKTKLVIVVSHDIQSAKKYGDYIINISKGEISNIKISDREELVFKNKEDLLNNIICLYECLSNYNNKFLICFNDVQIEMDTNKTYFNKNIISNIKLIPDNCEIRLKTEFCERESIVENIHNKEIFGLLFQIRYAIKLLFNKKIRTILSLLLIILSLSIMLFSFNILQYNSMIACNNAIKSSDYRQHSVIKEVYNEPTNEFYLHSKGEALYHEIDSIQNDSVICIQEVSRLTNNNQLFLNKCLFNVATDVTISELFNSIKLENNEIILSDFMSVCYFDDLEIGDKVLLNINGISEPVEYKVKHIYSTNYLDIDLGVKIFDEKYVYKNIESILNNYLCIYTTQNCYMNSIKSNDISLIAANFMLNDNYSIYTNQNTTTIYSTYNYDNIVLGEIPKKSNEIMISNKFLTEYFNSDYNVLGNEYSYMDLNSSLNFKKYYSIMNLYNLIPNVKVVGIFEGEADIIIHDEFMKAIKNKMFYYNCDYYGLNNPNGNTINYMFNNNISFSSEFLRPCYAMDDLLNSSLKILFIAINIILVILLLVVIYLTCGGIFKNKIREFAILKSLGIKDNKIINVFIIYYFIMIILSIIISLALSNSLLYGFNCLLGEADVYNINYQLFDYSYLSILVGCLFSILMLFISIIIPYLKTKKINIINLLKTN